MSLKASILLRTRLVCIVGVLVAGGILFQAIRIQYASEGQWRSASARLMQRSIALEANRGNIYASDGSLLATSLPYYKLAMDPTLPSSYLLEEALDSLTDQLSVFFGENTPSYYKSKILQARKQGRRYFPLIQSEISHATKKRIEKWPLAREGRLVGGVILDKVSRRFRPFGAIGIRTVGRLDEKQRGVVGLEYSFDQVLGGEDGRVLIERSVGGRWYPLYDGSEIHPRNGEDVITTIDVNIQEVVHDALLRSLREHDADFGCVIVMEVETGEIKAISNFSRHKSRGFVSDYNYAVGEQGVLEPGSTFKLATILALLSRSSLSLMDSVETGDGSFSFHRSIMRDDKTGGWGRITAAEAFERSSNIGIARLAVRHFANQPDLYTDYLKEKLHLDEPLGFQLKGEGRPYLKSPTDTSWSSTSLAWMSHGYELRVSPLQLLTLYNAVANQGKMIAPLLVRSIQRKDQLVEAFKSRVIEEEIATEEQIDQIRSLLEGVVLRGTARNIASPHYAIAGKTGTTKKYTQAGYVEEYRASFVGYFPADRPQYSCVVLVGNPRRGAIRGSEVAAPVFRYIADRICRRGARFTGQRLAQDMPRIGGGWGPDIQLICDRLRIPYLGSSHPSWVRTVNAGGLVAFRKATRPQKMPDMRGMLLRDALCLVENAGFVAQLMGRGPRVEAQSPSPFRQIEKGTKVILSLR